MSKEMGMKPLSLDLIAKQAVLFADQLRQAAVRAANETEIQIEAEKALAFVQKEAGISLEGRHNFTIGTGRPDSVYDCVIIEYKNPRSASDRLSAKRDGSGNKKVIKQLKERFYALRTKFERPLNTMFGVGCDGNYFIFLRFRDDKWVDQEPVEVNRYSAERFLWALINMGAKGKAFAPEYLERDFGSEAKLAQDGVRALYQTISGTDNPKALTFFQEWKIHFGEVCGYDVNDPSDKIKKLAEFYGVPGRLKPPELLFAVHTYYAIFMKLLASEIVASFHTLPTPLRKMINASTSSKLKREVEDLEAGSIFQHFNITNFLEGDLFTWYTAVWAEPIERLIREMVMKLDAYNPGTLSEDPARSRDLLKRLYQQLFPRTLRHDLGEYYTPDWLADHVLNELGYAGNPDKRLLDPACGSGTFLVMAINRIRRWYDENRERCPYTEGDLCRKILQNVIGFDLNPLAVMAARTNYLIAIRELIGYVDQVEIPVYLCDSIMTPSEYGDLFTGKHGKAMELKTSAARFLIPSEITTKREHLTKYAEQLEFCIRNQYSPEEFINRCRDEDVPITGERLHIDLYKEVEKLDKTNKNRIWGRIIKNAFAPLFIEKVDYVAGNPPWVNWESLPKDYRDSMKPLWQRYDLFTLSGSAGRLGGGKKDLSMLFVYASVDNYLRDDCRLGFVITQTVFKTKGAGDGFRQLRFVRDQKPVVLKPHVVHDFSDIQVFEGATNRTAVFVCQRSKKDFNYPIPYIVWRGPSRIDGEETLEQVRRLTERFEMGALPVGLGKATSPWLTVPKESLVGIQKVMGHSDYKAYEGVNSGGLNGCFWVRVLEKLKDGNLLIENLHDIGKIKVEHVQAAIEPDLVYPLLRGRDVFRWHAEPSAYIILAQDPETGKGISESEMKQKYPKTFAYLKKFEGSKENPKRGTLRGRALYKKYYNPNDPFYSMYNVGTYTLAHWKVVWRDMGNQIQVACVSSSGKKPLCPEHHVMAIPLLSDSEGFYVSGVLMSSPAQLIVAGYTTTTGMSTHVLENVRVRRYNAKDKVHALISNLSKGCHLAAATDDTDKLVELEAEADKAFAKLWGITDDELKAIQNSLKYMEPSRRRGRKVSRVQEAEEDEAE